MTSTHGSSGRLAAAPRHLSRRRFGPDVPDTMFVSESSVSQSSDDAVLQAAPTADRAAKLLRRASEPRRKRMVALALVIMVTTAVPALVLALVFLS